MPQRYETCVVEVEYTGKGNFLSQLLNPMYTPDIAFVAWQGDISNRQELKRKRYLNDLINELVAEGWEVIPPMPSHEAIESGETVTFRREIQEDEDDPKTIAIGSLYYLHENGFMTDEELVAFLKRVNGV